MTDNIIKLPDTDGNSNIYYRYFCLSCHYFIFGEDVGANYCPHCGMKLSWASDKAKDYHKMNFDYSIEYYERLKNGK